VINQIDFHPKSKYMTYCFYIHKEQYNLYVITGEYDGVRSSPKDSDLDLSLYNDVIVQLSSIKRNYKDIKSFDKYIKFVDCPTNVYLLPQNLACEMINLYLGKENIAIEDVIQPCNKCGLNDKWNSKGKDNNWYCYLHCKF